LPPHAPKIYTLTAGIKGLPKRLPEFHPIISSEIKALTLAVKLEKTEGLGETRQFRFYDQNC
jgi:hypothetical protein